MHLRRKDRAANSEAGPQLCSRSQGPCSKPSAAEGMAGPSEKAAGRRRLGVLGFGLVGGLHIVEPGSLGKERGAPGGRWEAPCRHADHVCPPRS